MANNTENNKRLIREYLEAKGFPSNAIPAIMGNIEVETGGTFDYKEKQKGRGKAVGLFQFDPQGGKYQDYRKYLGKYKDNMFNQIDYVWDTTYGDRQHVIGSGNAKKLRDSFENDTPDIIARNFSDIWLKPSKPHMERRLEATQAYLPPAQEEKPFMSRDELFGGFDYLKNMFGFGK